MSGKLSQNIFPGDKLMERMAASKIAKLCEGNLAGADAFVNGVVRDNREVRGGELFVALRGENFDGHDFVENAAQSGAAAALVSTVDKNLSIPQIEVRDTLAALSKLACGYRDEMPARRVCVTGSVGKTTTKEMIASVLSTTYKTHKTHGNYNNNIGLPLTILNMSKADEAAVLEIGTNHFGEILPLAELASPEIAVITKISDCHLEAFGTRDGVLREKLDILKGLVPGGNAVLNGDDELLWAQRGKLPCKVLWFGIKNPECDVYGVIEKCGADSADFSMRGSLAKFHITCGGEHNVCNSLAAIAVGRLLGISDEKAAEGLCAFKNTGMRQDVYEYNGITIIRDCYNASPDSMRAALLLLKSMECTGRRVAALGDMRELGVMSDALHAEIGQFAADCADKIFVWGEAADMYAKGANGKAEVFSDKDKLSEALCKYLLKGDALLVKGSYGTRMWQVLEYLQSERV